MLTGRGGSSAWRRLRLLILERDGYRCQIPLHDGRLCSAPATHVDHIVPRKYGGTEAVSNLRAACQPCNLKRGPGRAPVDPSAPRRQKPGARSAGPWRRLRAEVLRRDGDLCRWPTGTGGQCLAPATNVLHVQLPSTGGARNDPANLRATCAHCASHGYRNAAHVGNAARPDEASPPTWFW